MRHRRLSVDSFPGDIYIIDSSSVAEVHSITRAIEIPAGWHSSRSYRNHIGLVAMSTLRVGVDIEVIDLTVTAEAVLTMKESRLGGGPDDLCSWWSAKEALAKALGDARKYDPGRLETPALWPTSREGSWQAQRLEVPLGYVGWVVWETNLPV